MKIILIAAQSLDGFIAQERQQISTSWTSEADRHFFAQKTKEIGVMIMGQTTFATIGKPLPERTTIMLTQQTSYPGGQDLSQYHPGDKGGLYLTAGRSEPQVLDFLQQKQLPQLALCGGASVYQKFLSHDWVDELYLSIEPIVFGSGLRLFPDLSQLQRYQVLEVIKLSSQTYVWHLKR